MEPKNNSMTSAALVQTIEDLVCANRILAAEGVLDAFGHVSARHPDQPERFLLSCARSPALIEAGDIMVFDLEGNIVKGNGQPYAERVIHAAIYAARPDVSSVVHHHSQSILPFAVTDVPLVPAFHLGAVIGASVPVWDSRENFGDTSLLVSSMEMAQDMAMAMGESPALLLKRHGAVCVASGVRQCVFNTISMRDNAELILRSRFLGAVDALSPGEIALSAQKHDGGPPIARAWEYWVARL